jgi:hypothetical protein
VTASVQPATEDLLGAPDRLEIAADGVHVGGVEEGDAAGGGAVEDRHRGGLVALQAEGHGAETEPRDRQPRAAETDVSHQRLLAGCGLIA